MEINNVPVIKRIYRKQDNGAYVDIEPAVKDEKNIYIFSVINNQSVYIPIELSFFNNIINKG